MQNHAAEIKLRAERRAGEMLKSQARQPGETDKSIISHDATLLVIPKLSELGITKDQSSRWQLEADIPEEQFEQFIAETKAAAEELTSSNALKLAKLIKQAELPKETPPIPQGLFNVIYADPPWQYRNSGIAGAAAEKYHTLSIEEICNIKPPATDDAVLFLWATNPLVAECMPVITAWGFEYKTNIVWVKDKAGQGFYVKGQHELLLICTRGSMRPDDSLYVRSVVEAPRTEHSKKPDVFYEVIEQLYPNAKYLEMFARNSRQGWQVWGNQSNPNTAE